MKLNIRNLSIYILLLFTTVILFVLGIGIHDNTFVSNQRTSQHIKKDDAKSQKKYLQYSFSNTYENDSESSTEIDDSKIFLCEGSLQNGFFSLYNLASSLNILLPDIACNIHQTPLYILFHSMLIP